MVSRCFLFLLVLLIGASSTTAADTLYRYEGNVLPYDPSAGWVVFNACDDPCEEMVQDEHFMLEWPVGELVNYTLIVSTDAGVPPLPSTLWVEWRFRSNQSFGGVNPFCDADFVVRYSNVFDLVRMFGDTVITSDGGTAVTGLDVDEFNTYRFESLDGRRYQFSVDGQVFVDANGGKLAGGAFLQLIGDGGCNPDPTTINEWDFVRYGTIDAGEPPTILGSDE